MLMLDTINCDGPPCAPMSGAVISLMYKLQDVAECIKPPNSKGLFGKAEKNAHILYQ
jgi:hypothetical protein